ncbi:MAG TPA: hypothetical protein VNQ50_06825 [Xanthobacteraceae bacterium]|nr:hypothetical protein [Xanthobacteraceae bacterium]
MATLVYFVDYFFEAFFAFFFFFIAMAAILCVSDPTAAGDPGSYRSPPPKDSMTRRRFARNEKMEKTLIFP